MLFAEWNKFFKDDLLYGFVSWFCDILRSILMEYIEFWRQVYMKFLILSFFCILYEIHWLFICIRSAYSVLFYIYCFFKDIYNQDCLIWIIKYFKNINEYSKNSNSLT
jgi:hypothetical protein